MSSRINFQKQVFMGISRWDLFARGIFIAVFILCISEWPRLPYFMDCYYHLSVMRGFADAGGWVGRSFWEYAPFGRPHLYPPLFHILELLFFKAGLSPILIARLSQLVIYPLFLYSSWKLLRVFYNDRLAFFGLFLLTSSMALYLSVIILIPFSLAVIFALWSFYFFEKSKPLGCFLSLALAFYAHTLMAGLAVAGLMLYSLFSAKKIALCVRVCLLSVLVALPLLVHQMGFSSYVHFQRTMEFYYVQINLLILGLALAGVVSCLKKQGCYLFFISFSLSMVVLLFIYRNRFFSGQGLIPMCFLAAVALYESWQRLERVSLRVRVFFLAGLSAVFYFLTPVLEISPLQPKPRISLASRIPKEKKYGVGIDEAFRHTETFYYPKLVNEVVRLVVENSKPDEILFSNFNYAGGMISMLAHRATADAMLAEVNPFRKFDPVAASSLILWFKLPAGSSLGELGDLIARYRLEKVGETDIAYLYRNQYASVPMQVILASVPFWLCAVLLVLSLAGIFYSAIFPLRCTKKA